MIRRSIVIILVLCIMLVLFQYINTGAPGDIDHRMELEIIAHRGVHQHYIGEGKEVGKQPHRYEMIHGCEARKINKFAHEYIENTIESIRASFELGASIVEIDIRPTKDNQLVVFHDNTLDCKTNGKGRVADYSLAELKKLDVGYGYTSDNGQTFPLRGKGVAGIKTLNEILQYFPDKKFLIDNKNGNDLTVARLIVDVLSGLPQKQQENVYLWTQKRAFEYIHERLPWVKRLLLSRDEQKGFYKAYILSLGLGLGGVPEQYRGEGFAMIKKYTKYIWGWPYRFLGEVHDSGARIYLYANNQADFERFASLPVNGIITDYIEILEVSR